MAERRMFAKSVTDSDAFLAMPPKTQMLYFHLAMHADDDGFVGNPTRIQKMVGASSKDMTTLLTLQFIIQFESGVCVIKHWRIHNYIQRDRYHETAYKQEKRELFLDENNVYTKTDTGCIQNASKMDTKVRLGKVRVGKDSTGGVGGQPLAATRPSKRFVPPTTEEVTAYCKEKGYCVNPEQFVDFYTANGWKQGRGKPIVDWKAAVRTWVRRRTDVEERLNDDEQERY